ncbi:TPA: hypothetical protein ACPZB9_004343 [Yersinia enterocolitica]|uniref:hypothetical protein n=2 Tax=Yersinia TaxID=629 RepID=UPI001562A936|nr:hypothetical protein [Yersinia kristensenii]QKJ17320.1 hypothetical protein HRD70_20335 [Yersinia kristensenii]QKJ17496.1 hypothetical protein HRD70_21285 [Yersinia kristensenii]
MMDITKSREEFEAEFRKQHAGQPHIEMLLEMYNHGTDEEPEIDYYSLDARDAWKWWQASREGIVVELPTQDEYDDPLSAYNAISDCKKILRTAGIRIKGESE